MLKTYIFAGIGGAFGVMFRVFLAKIFPTHLQQFPSYILLVNILGCFLLGLIHQYFSFHSDMPMLWRSLIITGFLGGLTTFSACVLEIGYMLENNQGILACLYGASSMLGCFIAFMLGLFIIRISF